jgi:hypothetical protein
VIGTFKQFKSAGTDDIVLALLQQGAEQLVPYLCHVFRACLAYTFTPMAWKQAKATFIPKPGKYDYNEAKAYGHISLLSSFFNMMEKFVDRHIWNGVLKEHPLH